MTTIMTMRGSSRMKDKEVADDGDKDDDDEANEDDEEEEQ